MFTQGMVGKKSPRNRDEMLSSNSRRNRHETVPRAFRRRVQGVDETVLAKRFRREFANSSRTVHELPAKPFRGDFAAISSRGKGGLGKTAAHPWTEGAMI